MIHPCCDRSEETYQAPAYRREVQLRSYADIEDRDKQVEQAALDLRRSARRATPYMMMELMPVKEVSLANWQG